MSLPSALKARCQGKRAILKCDDSVKKNIYIVIDAMPAKFPGQASYLRLVPESCYKDIAVWDVRAFWQQLSEVEVLDDALTQEQIDQINAAADGTPVEQRPVNPHLPKEYAVQFSRCTVDAKTEQIADMIREMCLEHDAFNKLATLRAWGWYVAEHHDWTHFAGGEKSCRVHWELSRDWLNLAEDAASDVEALTRLWERIQRLSAPYGQYVPADGDIARMYRSSAVSLHVRLQVSKAGYITALFPHNSRHVPVDMADAVFELINSANNEKLMQALLDAPFPGTPKKEEEMNDGPHS